MDEAENKAPAARRPSRQGSLRLRLLAPGSINVPQAGDGSCHAAAGAVIPLLTPLHVAAAAEAAESSASGQHLPAAAASRELHAEVVAGGETRWAASWWHPAMPFVHDQQAAAAASSSVGFVFQNCV